MKKTILLGAVASAIVMLSSCSSEDEPIINGGEVGNAAQELVLQVSNTDDGMRSRAGRPLYSSEAKQSIDKVKLIICNSANQVKYVEDIANWNTGSVSTSYNTGGHGRMKTITIPEAQKLHQGTYTVYAVGYHSGSDYNTSSLESVKVDGTFNANTQLTLSKGVGEEIFAGSLELVVKEGVGFNSKIILNRQVAGAYGYFEAIPYVAGATKLQLVTKSSTNTNLVLGNFKNQILTSNGTSTTTEYVVNGASASENKVIYTINLKDWFGSDLKEKDGIFDTTNWTKPAVYGNNAKFKAGSVFGGEFIIPFAKTSGQGTFVLELTDDSNKVLKSWSINLDEESDGQCQNHTIYTFDGTKWNSATNKDEKNCYNVVRNHLYGIGARPQDTPEVPGNGPDDPEPLNKKEQLTLRVNDNWEVIHKMDIEEL
ncbi:MAG: hypothetical protein K2M93_00440 [Muribaculaceae bacterium]|nr:hypothetical protein [Muribaculaceae bacterium]